METNKEFRSIADSLAEVRAVEGTRSIEGYGIVFNKLSALLQNRFQEVIKPEAITGVIETSDVMALINHNPNRGVLARSDKGKGSMKLAVDKRGVKYSFEAPKFDLGDELVEGVKRGDIKGSSFSFSIMEGGESWEKRADGTYLRTITQFDTLYDMSPCSSAVAYDDTTVALRSLDTIVKESKDSKEKEDKPDLQGSKDSKEVIAAPVVAETTIENEVKAKEEDGTDGKESKDSLEKEDRTDLKLFTEDTETEDEKYERQMNYMLNLKTKK